MSKNVKIKIDTWQERGKIRIQDKGQRREYANDANMRLVADRASLTHETPPQIADDRTYFRACESEIMLPGPRAMNWIQVELRWCWFSRACRRVEYED